MSFICGGQRPIVFAETGRVIGIDLSYEPLKFEDLTSERVSQIINATAKKYIKGFQ